MKRKIISSLFALVLVLSFSLVTAVPAAAQEPIDLAVNGGNPWTSQAFTFTDVLPGEDLAPFPVKFENVGSDEGVLTFSLSYVEHDIATPPAPHMGADEFASLVYVAAVTHQYFCPDYPEGGGIHDDLPNWLGMDAFFGNDDGKLSLYELMLASPIPWATDEDDTLPAGEASEFVITFQLGDSLDPFSTGGDGISVEISATLVQVVEPYLSNTEQSSGNVFQAALAPVTIDEDGYYTIQAAVNAAEAGDTINVAAGYYDESLYIHKSLTVQSEEGAITEGGEWEPVTELYGYVEIELGWDDEVEPGPLVETVVFDGFYIDGYGINIYEVNNGSSANISNNILDGSYIYCGPDTVDNGSSVTIEGNEICWAYCGIEFEEVAGGSELTIRDNAIHDNAYGIYIDDVVEESTVTMVGNIVGGYEDEYVEYAGNGDSGIIVEYVVDSTLTIGGDTEAEANIISDNGWDDFMDAAGICIFETDNATLSIQGNLIGAYECEEFVTNGNYWTGISLWSIYDSAILIGGDTREEGNLISKNAQEGILVDWLEASSVEILNNGILDNYGEGSGIYICAYEGSSVDIHYNGIAGNGMGVFNDTEDDIVFDATCNFWGGPAGPQNPSNPYNTSAIAQENDAVSDDVDYSPWMLMRTLAKDWNIWSMPIAPDEDSWAQMQAELVEDGIDAIYYYDSANEEWGQVPDEANLLDAFYIKMLAKSRIRYYFSAEATWPSQKEMKVGWNFVGLAELYPRPVSAALSDALYGTGETELVGYNKVRSPSLNVESWTYLRGGMEDPLMFPGNGYWVLMVNDGVLGGFTETPIVP